MNLLKHDLGRLIQDPHVLLRTPGLMIDCFAFLYITYIDDLLLNINIRIENNDFTHNMIYIIA